MSVSLYGLKNCDSCRKARRWLADNGIEHDFSDLRDDPVSQATLETWAESRGWKTLLNQRSRSWREVAPERKQALDADAAIALMQEMPTLIKRPVLQLPDTVMVGFSAEQYEQALAGLD